VSIALFYVLFVCECVLYYCHRVSTQLQLTNISYIITPIIPMYAFMASYGVNFTFTFTFHCQIMHLLIKNTFTVHI